MGSRIVLLVLNTLLFYECNRPGEGSKKAGEHIKNMVIATVEKSSTLQTFRDDSADETAIFMKN